jgi:hypothetical protein
VKSEEWHSWMRVAVGVLVVALGNPPSDATCSDIFPIEVTQPITSENGIVLGSVAGRVDPRVRLGEDQAEVRPLTPTGPRKADEDRYSGRQHARSLTLMDSSSSDTCV